MSIHQVRSKLKFARNNNEYRKLLLKVEYPPYWDEGLNFYPRYRRGFKNSNKEIEHYQVRMYRTWKYNRKTQYKIK